MLYKYISKYKYALPMTMIIVTYTAISKYTRKSNQFTQLVQSKVPFKCLYFYNIYKSNFVHIT